MRTCWCADCGEPIDWEERHTCRPRLNEWGEWHTPTPKPVELRTVANQPDPAVVSKLEALLVRARTGEVRAVALASVNADGSVGTAWGGDRWSALLGCVYNLLCRLREEGKDGPYRRGR